MRAPHFLFFTLTAALLLTIGYRSHPVAAQAGPGADANIEVVRRFWDAFDRQAWDTLDELTVPHYVHHTNGSDAPLAQFKLAGMRMHRGMSGYAIRIDDAFASGDRVVIRWTATGRHGGSFFGETPTGKPLVVYGMYVHRLVDAKIAEDWEVTDTGNLRDQISAGGNAQ